MNTAESAIQTTRDTSPLVAALPQESDEARPDVRVLPALPDELQKRLTSERYTPEDVDLIRRAYALARQAHEGQKRKSGEDYITHPVAVAAILADLGMDADTLAAALLHDVVEDTGVTLDDIREEFGEEIASLVDGVTKLHIVDQLPRTRERRDRENAESLRKMFLAMINDVRVVLIKLADRLHNMRTLGAMPLERQKAIAQETLEIFAPLANRLGIWQVKWELEDLSFRYLNPEKYREIANKLAQKRSERERYIEEAVQILKNALEEAGIEAEVYGRPKHIYSIWRKMRRKGVDVDQIYDVLALRVLVRTVPECYQVLGIVHQLWTPIPHEFDDYIARPKDNMYQSLHTAVVGPNGHPLEVQIRTYEMHRNAEYGIAAHWRYKEPGVKRDLDFENKIAWLRQLIEWRQELTDAAEFVDSLKTDVFQDRVYVFTPKGDIIDLPAGATPVDFAYHVHTEVGHRCRGARVNGRIVPLNYQLQSGDQVEIITAKRGGPSRDWLNPHLGYVKTARARNKIRQWFRKQAREKAISEGKALLDKELRRLGMENESYENVARLMKYERVDDFLAAIGYGDITPQQVANRLLQEEQARQQREELERTLPETVPKPPERSVRTGISAGGVDGLLITTARCCNPVPGDDVVGYITRGRGITLHRRDCPNVLNNLDRDRLIEVTWRAEQRDAYPVRIRVLAYDRPGLLRDISTIVSEEGINIIDAYTHTDPKKHIAEILATLEITNAEQLSRVLNRIERLPNVIEVRRQRG